MMKYFITKNDPEFDYKNLFDTDKFKIAVKEIGVFIDNISICTYGSLTRRFPLYNGFLDQVLDSLRESRRITWDRSKPPPTRIKTMNCTVRVDKESYKGVIGKAYKVTINGKDIFFPKSITEKEGNGKFIDLNCPLWFANKNDLKDYVVAEY